MGPSALHGRTPILASLVRDDILRDLTYTGGIFFRPGSHELWPCDRICDDPLAAALEVAREIAGKSPDAIRPPSACSTNCPSIPPRAARRIRRAAEAVRQPQPDRGRPRQHGKRVPRFAEAG